MTKRKTVDKGESPKLSPISNILSTRYRLKCKNQKQKQFANLITEKEIVFATGPAGVGKSYIANSRAIELLQNTSNNYNKILIINPAVEAEEKLGFLPGSVREKLDPFVGPSIDIFDKIISKEKRVKLESEGIIEVGGLGFIRGKTIDNTILIMEEGQNMSPNQMKTLLTRIGSSTKFIISGDLDQSDRYTNYKSSGLFDAIKKHSNLDEIGLVEFDESEIVRNPLISLILEGYKTKEPINVQPLKVKENNIRTIKKNHNKFLRKIKIFFRKNFRW
jgi:phosphate starvation-inducible PhoH-like protein